MKLEEMVWLACAIDGEGWLGLYTQGKWPVVEIGITNTNVAFIQHVIKIVGGKVRSQKNGITAMGNKPLFRTSIKGHEHVLSVLKDILPYLIIKQEKAAEMIKFIEGREWGINSPEGKKHKIEGLKKMWANPEHRVRHIKGLRHGIDADVGCSICGGKYSAKRLCAKHYHMLWYFKNKNKEYVCVS